MAVVEDILAERNAGHVRCGMTAASTLLEVAAAFGLKQDASLYRPLEREAAQRLMQRLLQRDLAYGTAQMSSDRAQQLAERFLAECVAADATCFANVALPDGSSWNPATDATFDQGVLFVSPSGGACFWVEDED